MTHSEMCNDGQRDLKWHNVCGGTLPQKEQKLMLLATYSRWFVALTVPWDLRSGPYETGDASLPLQIGSDVNSGEVLLYLEGPGYSVNASGASSVPSPVDSF